MYMYVHKHIKTGIWTPISTWLGGSQQPSFFRGFFSTLFLQPCHDLPYTMHNKKNLCCPAAEEMSLWFWRLREGAMNKAAEMSPVQGSAETNLYGGFRGDLIIKNAGRMRI